MNEDNHQGKLKKIKIPVSQSELCDESEILGIMLGDGNIMHNQRSLRLRVRELDFCMNFKTLVERTYNINTTLDHKYYYNCYANSTLLAKRIIELTKHNKEIPKYVLVGSPEIKARFLRGFFDSEGSVDIIYNRRQIVLTQNSEKLLLQVKSLLWDLGIQSKYFKKRVGSDKLVISLLENLEKYHELVGFSIKYKQDNLGRAIDYLRKFKAHDKNKYWIVLRHWASTRKSLRSAAKETGMKLETYRSWAYGIKTPCQIKKDIEFGVVPPDYENLREQYSFLPLPNST